jgi:glycosyltransferase involved in cell wall biosynthesis
VTPPAAAPRVLVFGTYDAQAHPRVQVVIDGLRAHGIEVEECNVPLGLDTAARVELLRRPWIAPRFALRVASRWVELWRKARGRSFADAVLVPYLGHFDVHLARLRFRRTPVILDHFISGSDTAKDRGVSGPVRDLLLTAVDRAALRAATVALVDTEEHRDLMPAWARPKAIVVLIGAPDSWAAPPRPAYDGHRALRVIFFGLFTPLQGPVTIGRALALLAGDDRIEVTMVGAGQQLEQAKEAARANPRVRWPGMIPPLDLPAMVAHFDVCLGIFADNPKGLRVVPNKAYQGVRAGCAIVTSDTVPQRRTLGSLAMYVRPGDAEALARTLQDLASDPARVGALQAASRAASDLFSPAGVVVDLVDWLRAR